MSQSTPLYRSIAASVGIGIGAAAGLLLIAMLRLLVGPFEIVARPEAARALRVGLWEPDSAFVDPEAKRLENQERWRAVLPPGAELRVARRLESLMAEVSLVAVANAAVLSESELEQLETWIGSGGSALLAGWVGAPGPGGRRAALARALGVARARTLRADSPRGIGRGERGPLSSGITAQIALAPVGAFPLLDQGGELSASATTGSAPLGAASYRAARGAGRLVWLALEPGAEPVDPAARDSLQRIWANAIAWAAGEPVAELSSLPSDRGAISLALVRTGPYRMRLEVTNHAEGPATDLVVRIHPNRALGVVRAEPTMLFQPAPEVYVAAEHVDLVLPELLPGSSRDYAIDLLPPRG